MPHLPLFTMPTCIHLFLSYFCFFWPQNDLFFYALEPILCHFLRTLILTICCSVAQLCLTLSTSWTAACQASLSFTISWSLLKHVHWVNDAIQPSHLLLPPLLLSSVLPSLRVFSNKSAFYIRWPKYWSLNFSISHSSEYWGLISFWMDWCDLLTVQGTLQHHSSKASILQLSSTSVE